MERPSTFTVRYEMCWAIADSFDSACKLRDTMSTPTRVSQVIFGENISSTFGGKSVINYRRDARHKGVQQFGRFGVVREICTLPSPHRDEFLSSGLFSRAGNVPHEKALERVWENLHAGRVHRVEQLILDRTCEPAGKSTSQRRLAGDAAEQGLAMRRTRARFFTGEERRADLNAFGTEREGGNNSAGIGDSAGSDNGHRDPIGDLWNQ